MRAQRPDLVIDTSVLIAVVAGEKDRDALIDRTRGMTLVAPSSVHWEVGNALAAMLKRRRATLDEILLALAGYEQIPIRLIDVGIADALRIADAHDGIYAYDAYLIACAARQRCPLITLDNALAQAASSAGIDVLEMSS